MTLPVKIELNQIAVEYRRLGDKKQETYRIRICFISDKENVYKRTEDRNDFIEIGTEVLISWVLFGEFLMNETGIVDISWRLGECHKGVCFYIWLEKEERSKLEIMIKEVLKSIRIFIENILQVKKLCNNALKEIKN